MCVREVVSVCTGLGSRGPSEAIKAEALLLRLGSLTAAQRAAQGN